MINIVLNTINAICSFIFILLFFGPYFDGCNRGYSIFEYSLSFLTSIIFIIYIGRASYKLIVVFFVIFIFLISSKISQMFTCYIFPDKIDIIVYFLNLFILMIQSYFVYYIYDLLTGEVQNNQYLPFV